jgi:serine/threonine protein kinase
MSTWSAVSRQNVATWSPATSARTRAHANRIFFAEPPHLSSASGDLPLTCGPRRCSFDVSTRRQTLVSAFGAFLSLRDSLELTTSAGREKERAILAMHWRKRRVLTILRTIGITRKTAYTALDRNRILRIPGRAPPSAYSCRLDAWDATGRGGISPAYRHPVGPANTTSIADPTAATRGAGTPIVADQAPPPRASMSSARRLPAAGRASSTGSPTPSLGREVAVKVLQEKYRPASAVARRFADEARTAAQLHHPAIPPVHDLGTLPSAGSS